MKNQTNKQGAKGTSAKGANGITFTLTLHGKKDKTGTSELLLSSFTLPYKGDESIKTVAGQLIFAAKVAAANEIKGRKGKQCLYYMGKQTVTIYEHGVPVRKETKDVEKAACLTENDILLTVEMSSDVAGLSSSAIVDRFPLCVNDDKAARQHQHARNIVEAIVSPLTAEINAARLMSVDASYFEENSTEEYTGKDGKTKKRPVVRDAFRVANRLEIYKQNASVSVLSK